MTANILFKGIFLINGWGKGWNPCIGFQPLSYYSKRTIIPK